MLQSDIPLKMTKVQWIFVRKLVSVFLNALLNLAVLNLTEAKMANKGSFSFVAMLVINPVIILFYQNCSMTPQSYAKTQVVQTRAIASEGVATKAVGPAAKKVCPQKKSPCAE